MIGTRLGAMVADLISSMQLAVTMAIGPPTIVMESDGVRVAAGGSVPGWVTGSFAGAADGAVNDVVFDLGPDWDQYHVLQLIVQPVGALSLTNVQTFSSDTSAINMGRRVRDANSATKFDTINVTLTTSAGAQSTMVRPAGRYFFVRGTNTAGNGAMGATKVIVASYTS